MYYYTPLPLNLANNKEASNKHFSFPFLVIAPSQRFGLSSTLAILEPRWSPCQIQLLSPRLFLGPPWWGRQVGRCPPKITHFVPQNRLFFGPKTAPKRT